MLNLLKISVIILLFKSGFNVLETKKPNQSKNSLSHIRSFVNEYPSNAKLFNDTALGKRLKSLLKNRFLFLKNTWAVETPIEIRNNQFIAWGCQQHNCSNTNFIIVVDFTKNVVHVGIREEEQVKIYSENGTSNKQVLKWANRN